MNNTFLLRVGIALSRRNKIARLPQADGATREASRRYAINDINPAVFKGL